MEKGIIKIIIIVMVIYIALLVGSVCLLTHYGESIMQSVSKPGQTNQYNGTEKPFSVNPIK